MEKVFKSEKDVREVMRFVESGVKPGQLKAQADIDRDFLRRNPELLKNPDNQKLFSKSELKKLLK
ncbi:hypothetical protein BSQ39_11625 [Loigolactobacillus backii]|uniref:hypothetical protein n=1 Tax=Loigolactobacillus backii TaxID=375175 RepID=UPI000C1C851B|nr:hypothetical protein [Loigolactobacillus backii]PIO84163.1 hypothetical protein BSQ39_11625 [Loigolactobacillus backii]